MPPIASKLPLAQACNACDVSEPLLPFQIVYNIDSLAEWSKALASGASPQGRGLEPHSCHSSPEQVECSGSAMATCPDWLSDRSSGGVGSSPNESGVGLGLRRFQARFLGLLLRFALGVSGDPGVSRRWPPPASQDNLADWSNTLASGAGPQRRGLEPRRCHSSRGQGGGGGAWSCCVVGVCCGDPGMSRCWLPTPAKIIWLRGRIHSLQALAREGVGSNSAVATPPQSRGGEAWPPRLPCIRARQACRPHMCREKEKDRKPRETEKYRKRERQVSVSVILGILAFRV